MLQSTAECILDIGKDCYLFAGYRKMLLAISHWRCQLQRGEHLEFPKVEDVVQTVHVGHNRLDVGIFVALLLKHSSNSLWLGHRFWFKVYRSSGKP